MSTLSTRSLSTSKTGFSVFVFLSVRFGNKQGFVTRQLEVDIKFR